MAKLDIQKKFVSQFKKLRSYDWFWGMWICQLDIDFYETCTVSEGLRTTQAALREAKERAVVHSCNHCPNCYYMKFPQSKYARQKRALMTLGSIEVAEVSLLCALFVALERKVTNLPPLPDSTRFGYSCNRAEILRRWTQFVELLNKNKEVPTELREFVKAQSRPLTKKERDLLEFRRRINCGNTSSWLLGWNMPVMLPRATLERRVSSEFFPAV